MDIYFPFSLTMFYLVYMILFSSVSPKVSGLFRRNYTSDSPTFAVSKFYEAATICEEANFVISPFAAWTTLSIAFNGINETTYRQLFSIFFSSDPSIDGLQFKSFEDPSDDTNFWSSIKNYFNEKFYPTIKSNELLRPEETSSTINEWIDQQINLKISNRIIRSEMSSTSDLVLVNAIEKWTTKFHAPKTSRRFFYLNGSVSFVPTMEIRGSYKYNNIAGLPAQIIELPYEYDNASDSISMFLIVPKSNSNITYIEKQLQNVQLASLFKGKLRKMILYLPEFKFESKIDFKTALNDFGMSEEFIKSGSFFNFKHLGKKVNQIFQQVSIEVIAGIYKEQHVDGSFNSRPTVLPSYDLSVLAHAPFLIIICTKDVVLFTARVGDPISNNGLRKSVCPINLASTWITDSIDVMSQTKYITRGYLNSSTAEDERLTEPETLDKVVASTSIRPPENICLTPFCVQTASQLLKNMDTSIEPCENFYQFACGGFVDLTPIPDYQSAVSTMSIANDKLEGHLKTILQKEIQPDEPKAFVMAKNLYKNCMDEDKIEKQRTKPLVKIMEKLHGWPLLQWNQWNEDEFNWIEYTYKLHSMGYTDDSFMKISVDVDRKNIKRRVIYVSPPTPKRRYETNLFSEDEGPSYKHYMTSIADLFGMRGRYELNNCYNFGLILEKLSQEYRGVSINLKYNPITILELSQIFPSIPWKEYFTKLFPSNIEISDNELIIVESPSYIRDLIELMSKTEKRVQSNYMMWNVIVDSVRYLNENTRKKYLIYVSETTGQTEMKPRWKECINVVRKKMPLSIGALYVRNHFQQKSKKNVDNIVEDIREYFINSVDNFNWMDDNKKSRTRDRLKTMSVGIAYPKELLNDSKLDEVYEGLELSNDNYFQNILELKLFERQYSFGKLREPVNDDSKWINYGRAAELNPNYSLFDNIVELPAGILQDDFFSIKHPMYMNYGAIGFIAGHEIVHAFDITNGQLDSSNFVPNRFSSVPNKDLHDAQCFTKQYDRYFVAKAERKINGQRTQEENIADNGGIKGAYRAYKKWLSSYEKLEPKLPSLPYTPSQMFWISAANVFCAKKRKLSLIHTIETSMHSPEEFRIIGSFSNMLEFAEDFKCSNNSQMNPVKKCNF